MDGLDVGFGMGGDYRTTTTAGGIDNEVECGADVVFICASMIESGNDVTPRRENNGKKRVWSVECGVWSVECEV